MEMNRWDKLGFLDGLNGNLREDISKLYESQPSQIISEHEVNWSLYMVECSDGTIYTGTSNDVIKRVLKHNMGKGAKYTKTRLPVTLKYEIECGSRSDACKLESKYKKLTKEQKLKLINEKCNN
jgi:putative endonuclease